MASVAINELVRRKKLAVRFHDLRHTHISHLLMAGVHPKIVSERAGHASVAITLDVYSHVIPGMQEDAANKIDAALRTHLEHDRKPPVAIRWQMDHRRARDSS
jgi:integrase